MTTVSKSRELLLGERIMLANMIGDPSRKFTNDQLSFAVGAIHALDWLLGVRGQNMPSQFLEECDATSRIRP